MMKGKTKENQGNALEDVTGQVLRMLTNAESKELFYRNKKLQEEAKEKRKMRAMHRRDKEYLEDFGNEPDRDVRGNLLGKHADDSLNIMRYGADAQAGRSFGQKTRGRQSKIITGKAKGGAVKNYKHGGAVMAGRGGSFKGIK
jgi:hypothetical protein